MSAHKCTWVNTIVHLEDRPSSSMKCCNCWISYIPNFVRSKICICGNYFNFTVITTITSYRYKANNVPYVSIW